MHKKSLKFVFTGILLAGAAALMSQTTSPNPPAKPKTALQASMDRGQQVYHDQCLACHQVDALGTEEMNPPLVGTKEVLGDKTALVRIVLNGLKGVQVGGEDYRNTMAPHKDLTDRQIADVLTYIRNSFGNKASAVSAAQVKAIRAKTKPNP